MERGDFWRVVEGARAEAGSDTERVAQVLLRRLRELKPSEIEHFQELWERAHDDLYSWPIHDAATLMLGPLRGDALFAVQDWILSHGRRTIQTRPGRPRQPCRIGPGPAQRSHRLVLRPPDGGPYRCNRAPFRRRWGPTDPTSSPDCRLT
ncbi:MAG TPA: DUF4240 domain-containing protein [Actinoplanes sp.]|nr:DUF4240 domain-containing protein [Actinoplanes sp.]